MIDKDLDSQNSEVPQYSIAEIIALLEKDEAKVRKLIKKAGVEIDESKNDTNEQIRYEDFCKLWVSLANRREGWLLSTMLVEESGNWWIRFLGKSK